MSKIEELIKNDEELTKAYFINPAFCNVVNSILYDRLDDYDGLIILVKYFIKENSELKEQLKEYIVKYGSL